MLCCKRARWKLGVSSPIVWAPLNGVLQCLSCELLTRRESAFNLPAELTPPVDKLALLANSHIFKVRVSNLTYVPPPSKPREPSRMLHKYPAKHNLVSFLTLSAQIADPSHAARYYLSAF